MTQPTAGGKPAGAAVVTVALVGPRAAGKTTVGRELAARLGWASLDADDELASRAGVASAGAFLRQHGEAAFRALESEVSVPLLQRPATVVALGGGAVLTAAVCRELQRPDVLVALLLAAPAELARRIAADPTPRPPLLGGPLLAEVEQLLLQRLPRYRAVADCEFDSGALAAAAIAAALCARVRP